MSEPSTGDGSRPENRNRAHQLSHAPGSPRRQVQFGDVCCVQVGSASSIHVRVRRADWILTMAVPFTFAWESGSQTLDPTGQPGLRHIDLAPLLILVGTRVHAPEWDRNGLVVVDFGDGLSLACPPDPLETAWTVTGPHGQTWSCRPGGHVVREGRSSTVVGPPGRVHSAR